MFSYHKTKSCLLKLSALSNVCLYVIPGYEKAWHTILKERIRRNTILNAKSLPKKAQANVDLDTNGQLQMLTEIKKHVNENNNLIKKRLDNNTTEQDGDSIKVLAEKNFSELNRLSKMADRSVKIFSGQDTRKRDLNPGFDSENIQKPPLESKNYPPINIPNISKIISLKTLEEGESVSMSTQATSMDEPQSSAAGVQEMFLDTDGSRVKDFGCQVEEALSWPGVEAAMKSYKEYDAGMLFLNYNRNHILLSGLGEIFMGCLFRHF